MNRKANTVSFVAAGAFVLVIGFFVLINKFGAIIQISTRSDSQEFTAEGIPKEGLLKAQIVPLITDVQMLDLDLKNYYKSTATYPASLKAFVRDNSYSNRSVFISQDRLSKYHYVVSPDYKHFVIYLNLSLPKDKIGPVNDKAINIITKNILGVECADPRIFCLTDQE